MLFPSNAALETAAETMDWHEIPCKAGKRRECLASQGAGDQRWDEAEHAEHSGGARPSTPNRWV
jgi:hypothetical protein